MKIVFNTDTIKPMADWLMDYKKTGNADEMKLRSILQMSDYQVEFERYGAEGLPVCGISFEEAVDFFMNFDKKEFENPRLQYKKEGFMSFFNNLESKLEMINMFTDLQPKDYEVIEKLLENGLPETALSEIAELNVMLVISIGNSMGWPYDHYIDYDVAQLEAFSTKEDFLHVTAHEIHHMILGQMLAPEGIKPEGFFLQNFAYEGLAVHFNNNQSTLFKPSKYADKVYCMQEADMAFYEENFEEIFGLIMKDYEASKALSLEEVSQLVSDHYEIFEFMGKPVLQYPTYYFGCYMWGIVDMAFGKEALFDSITHPEKFLPLYNQVAPEKYRFV